MEALIELRGCEKKWSTEEVQGEEGLTTHVSNKSGGRCSKTLGRGDGSNESYLKSPLIYSVIFKQRCKLGRIGNLLDKSYEENHYKDAAL